MRSRWLVLATTVLGLLMVLATVPATDAAPISRGAYPLHTRIVATTFWVGEIFDPNAADGSQVMSTYDDNWMRNYGGCDGVRVGSKCKTEKRVSSNGYFPRHMKPKQNPFYLALPYDDLNDRVGLAARKRVIHWANRSPWSTLAKNKNASIMKDRWVKIYRKGRVCYGQVEDAGPGQYHNGGYVFSKANRRPANKRYNGSGMDVSPALNGCLRFSEINGQNDTVSWRFVEAKDVPAGPWKKIVTKTKW